MRFKDLVESVKVDLVTFAFALVVVVVVLACHVFLAEHRVDGLLVELESSNHRVLKVFICF